MDNSPFKKLPAELRNRIYDIVLESSHNEELENREKNALLPDVDDNDCIAFTVAAVDNEEANDYQRELFFSSRMYVHIAKMQQGRFIVQLHQKMKAFRKQHHKLIEESPWRRPISDNNQITFREPALLHVCREIRNEARPIFHFHVEARLGHDSVIVPDIHTMMNRFSWLVKDRKLQKLPEGSIKKLTLSCSLSLLEHSHFSFEPLRTALNQAGYTPESITWRFENWERVEWFNIARIYEYLPLKTEVRGYLKAHVKHLMGWR